MPKNKYSFGRADSSPASSRDTDTELRIAYSPDGSPSKAALHSNGVLEDSVVIKADNLSDDGSSSSSSSSSSDADSTKSKKKKEKPPMVGVAETFRFATGKDKLIMFLSTLCAMAHGSALPVSILIFGNMSDTFIDAGAFDNFLAEYVPVWAERCANMTALLPAELCDNITTEFFKEDPTRLISTCILLLDPPGCDLINSTTLGENFSLTETMREYAIVYAILGSCAAVVAYCQVVGWQTAAYNQAQRIRVKLFKSILRKEIGWYDVHESGELNTRLSDDVNKIEAGLGDKLALFIQYNSAFIAGIVIGFVYSWKLTLVILSVSPLLAGSAMLMGKVGTSMTSKELKAYAKAGAVAEEVFGAIRTVVAFDGQRKECERYNKNLVAARDFGIKKGMTNGISMALVFFIMFGSYALGFWYGSKLVFQGEITPGNLITVFFAVLIGTFSIGNASPNIQNFASARGAAYAIYNIIDSPSVIDSDSKEGVIDESLDGNVEFRDIHFNYPSRPEVKILRGLSLKVNVGQTVALVGASGCGKSTTVQMIQRFYDPESGQVTIGGRDIREYNVKWLRQQIGVVSQEPVLFATTIADNIRYGREDVTADEIIKACREANAHDFISKLPDKYDTLVGERGAQLSGGQKQRIAIARALVRNPKVLLLDEATSALDTESEASVQAALDTARQGRTTLVIAHRLSTIRTADVIMGIKDGQVVEQGTHDQLMAQSGLYYELCTNQQTHFDGDDESIDEELPLKPELERALSFEHGTKLNRGMSVMSNESVVKVGKSSVENEEEKLAGAPLKRIMRMNSPEWCLIIFGCICSIIVGGVQPAFAIVFADIISIFAESGPQVQQKINLYSGMFAVIGTGAAIGMIGMNVCFSRSGENLTLRMRQLSFQSLLKQEMAYFDEPRNGVGALCTRLATDASAVQGATGSRLGTFCQAIASLGAGLVIGFVYSWELTLLIVGFGPLLLASGFVQMKIMSGNETSNKKTLEDAGKIAIETIENIRTVATLTKEQKFYDDFVRETRKPYIKNKKRVHVQALAYAISQGIMYFANAACFMLGGYLVDNRGLYFRDMFRVFSAVLFGAVAAGEASSFAPNYGKAKISAAKIFALFDRQPTIDSSSTEGTKLPKSDGTVQLRGVEFNYPTRPNVPVMQNMDLSVMPGQTVALVGSSGCGKSTTVQLLERFYDPLQGSVMYEGHDIRELNLTWLRSQMGIVSQEPILFDCSIRDNIAYGDNSREVSMAEIIEAAKNANIHSFVESLPQGYDTNVGEKGAQLSGGQKQRVAIARALIRNPKLLLLDEATSALDTESEKVVQAALDRAQEGRTCIVIAHRLSTIQNADCIVVIHHGRVVEMGKHQELLQQRGRYYKLNNAQLKKR